MSLSPETRARIEQILGAHQVVLFMKGNPNAPQCGFSAKAAGILNGLVPGFGHVDVLADPEIREGIKVYGQWPTIPQLYVGGELLGGSDIIEQMLNSGELHEALGLPAPDRRANGGAMPPPGTRMRLPDPYEPLEALLELNRYCRDGYVTLEQYRMGMQQVIRGECRDDATEADRQRFSS